MVHCELFGVNLFQQDDDCLQNDPECSGNGSRCYNVLTGRFHCDCNDGFYGETCGSIRRATMIRGRGSIDSDELAEVFSDVSQSFSFFGCDISYATQLMCLNLS